MQTVRGTIWKNSLFVSFSQVIRLITNFLIFIGIARFYGPVTLGQFIIAFTIANICLVLADFGFDVLLTSEIAKNRTEAFRIGRKYFSMKIIFAGISSFIMIIISSFQAFSETSRILVYILTLYVVFTTFTNFFYAVFRGFERFEYETKISFITNFLLLISLGICGFLKVPIVPLVLFFIAARFIGCILCLTKSRSLIGKSILKIDFEGARNIIKKIFIFGLHFLFGNLFFQLDTILLGLWKGDIAAGIYQSAFRIMLLILLIPNIAISSVLPLFSRLYGENIAKWKNLSRLLYKVLLLAALPISIILFFYSEELISTIYGHELFKEAVPILKIFSFIIVVRFGVEPYALMITTSKRQYIRMIIVIIATIISCLINYFIIPTYGLYGTAIVSLGVNIIVGVGYIAVYYKYFLKWTFERRTFIVLAIVISLILLLSFSHARSSIIWVSLAVYLLSAYFIGLSNEDKKVLFSNLFSKTA